jgi:heme oxygenase
MVTNILRIVLPNLPMDGGCKEKIVEKAEYNFYLSTTMHRPLDAKLRKLTPGLGT